MEEGMTKPRSYRPMVLVQGSWSGNGLRFATRDEAERNARDLMSRWTLVEEARADESPDLVTHRFTAEGDLVSL